MLVLYDYSKCTLDEGVDDELVKKLNELKIEPLNEKERIKLFEVIPENGCRKINVSNYVGFSVISNYTIAVLPRVFKRQGIVKAAIGLVKMLDYAFDLGIKVSTANLMEAAENGLHEIFFYLFAEELRNQIYLGLYREYQRYRGEEKILRGKLLLTKQLRKPPSKLHTFSVEYFLLSNNNLLNRIFRTVSELSLKYSRYRKTRLTLSEIISLLDNVEPLPLPVLAKPPKIKFTRLNKRFEKAYNLALIILYGLSELTGGETNGFFVKSEELFEEYIRVVLRRYGIGRSCWSYKGDKNKLILTRQIYPKLEKSSSEESSSGEKTQQEPDIIVECEDRITCLDVKYKDLEKENSTRKPEAGDLRQLYVYARALAKHDKNRGRKRIMVFLVYPYTGSFNNNVFRETKYYLYEYIVAPHDRTKQGETIEAVEGKEPLLMVLCYNLDIILEDKIDYEFINLLRCAIENMDYEKPEIILERLKEVEKEKTEVSPS